MTSIINYTKVLFSFLLIIYSAFLFSQEKTASTILTEVQEQIQRTKNYTCNLEYALYPTYTSKTSSEIYDGSIIKHNNNYYIKINKTIFLTDSKTKIGLKLNEDQKVILVSKHNENISFNQSPIELSNIIKLFKTRTVEDKGSQWLCTLKSDVLTQLPYGKVEIYVNKKDYSISKQILYFLTKFPYSDPVSGKEILALPKLEINISNQSQTISIEEKKLTDINTYIHINKDKIYPALVFKDFKIIQN